MKENQLKLSVKADLDMVSFENPTERIIELSIEAPDSPQNENRQPLNLALVLDRSGSMSGEKLEYVKKAALHVLEQLEEKDHAALVVFDDEVNMLSTSLSVSSENREILKRALASVRTGGTTNLSGGWLSGCEQVAGSAQETSINRTLLLTDGLANVGITDLEELAKHSRELFRRGVTTSTFGVGRDYNQHLLEAMANQGGGSYYFIQRPRDIPGIFSREFQELASTTAADVEVAVQLPDAVQAKVPGDWQVEQNGNQIRLYLGHLFGGRVQQIYLKCKFPATAKAGELEVSFALRGKDTSGDLMEANSSMLFKCVSNEELEKAAPDQELLERFSKVDLAQAAHEALVMERRGDRRGAHQMMQATIRNNKAFVSEAMANDYHQMSERMLKGMDELDRKQSHYRTYIDKKQRREWREFELERPDGLLMIEVDGHRVLIDTGSPVSIGPQDSWFFLGKRYRLTSNYLGVRTDYLSKMVGTNIDILMGMDILHDLDLKIDGVHQMIEFTSQEIDLRARHISLQDFMSIPVVKHTINGSELNLFFDTGAKITYLAEEFSRGYSSDGKVQDFYPGFGAFETNVYNIPVEFLGERAVLQCGVLPAMLEQQIRLAGAQGILGADLFEHFEAVFSMRRRKLFLRPHEG